MKNNLKWSKAGALYRVLAPPIIGEQENQCKRSGKFAWTLQRNENGTGKFETLGSLSNDDGDGNEDNKKGTG